MPCQFTQDEIYAFAFCRALRIAREEVARLGGSAKLQGYTPEQITTETLAEHPEMLKESHSMMQTRKRMLDLIAVGDSTLNPNNKPQRVKDLQAQWEAEIAAEQAYLADRAKQQASKQDKATKVEHIGPASVPDAILELAKSLGGEVITVDMSPEGIDAFNYNFRQAKRRLDATAKKLHAFNDAHRATAPDRLDAGEGIDVCREAMEALNKYDEYDQLFKAVLPVYGLAPYDYPDGARVLVGKHTRLVYRCVNGRDTYDYYGESSYADAT